MEITRPEAKETGALQAGDSPALIWRVHLLREQPAKMLLVVPAVAAGLIVSLVLFRSLLFTAVTLFLVLASLAEFVFPVRYELDAGGATVRTVVSRTRVEWARVRKYYLDDDGIKLSTLARPGRLEAYRGVYLRFGDRRDEVIRVVRMMRDAVDGSSQS